MDRGKDLFKRGWHPEPEGTTLRSQVSGLVGRNKKTAAAENEHVARPLTTLKDPSQFGPPPKNVNYHGGAALPNTITPDRSGLGAPVATGAVSRIRSTNEQEEEVEHYKPPTPYRADRTGLSTAGLPAPPRPIRRDDDTTSAPVVRPKPKLPPRLPPRQHSTTSPSISSPPPPYSETIPATTTSRNAPLQGATTRLGQSGIGVPSLGIRAAMSGPKPADNEDRQEQNPWRNQSSQSSTSPSLNGLRNQFSSLSTNSQEVSSDAQSKDSASGGTTWAQKQAALSTASQLQRDPSKVKAADAKEAVSTANDFRQRHGEDVAKGWKTGQGINQKYGIANKVSAYTGSAGQAGGDQSVQSESNATAAMETPNPWAGQLSNFKKAPPPPPPTRRPTDPPSGSKSPPPIPFGSKPR